MIAATNRREVVDSEIDSFAAWRTRHFDYSEIDSHLRYVSYLITPGGDL